MKHSSVLSLLLLLTVSVRADEWKPLFNGRDLSNWDMFMTVPDTSWDVPGLRRDANGKYLEPIGLNKDPLKVFNVATVDGGPVIYVTGQGFGTITTKESYGNFHLRLQIKWGDKKWGSKIDKPRDCGLLYFGHGALDSDHGTWPRSLEFQIQEHDMGDLYALSARVAVHARLDGRLRLYDPKGELAIFEQKPPVGNRCVKLDDPEKPKGEWNTLELFCVGSESLHVVNGTVVMRLHKAERLDGDATAPLTSGKISLQTEGAEVYYRKVEITTIASFPAQYAE